MKKNVEKKYRIDPIIVNNYVNAINSLTEPMTEIKAQINDLSEPLKLLSDTVNKTMEPVKKVNIQISETMKPVYESINKMSEEIKKLSNMYSNEQTKIMTNSIKQIMESNNGIITSRLIEPLNISKQYLSDLTENNEIEKIMRGIYISTDVFEDSFYSFQSKYKKAIFSHMNAFYFYDMTEEFPYRFTVTVPKNYHVDNVNEKCDVFYVSDDIYELGLCKIETPNGNMIRTYDLERSICDIIKSKNRMDFEQVKKVIRTYIKSNKKDMVRLSEYSEKMGIKKQVMEMVGMLSE